MTTNDSKAWEQFVGAYVQKTSARIYLHEDNRPSRSVFRGQTNGQRQNLERNGETSGKRIFLWVLVHIKEKHGMYRMLVNAGLGHGVKIEEHFGNGKVHNYEKSTTMKAGILLSTGKLIMITSALQCLEDDTHERPDASDVVIQLRNALEYQRNNVSGSVTL
ncbi:hypothetical protein Tco_1360200 [Tanacetum coccineum]